VLDRASAQKVYKADKTFVHCQRSQSGLFFISFAVQIVIKID